MVLVGRRHKDLLVKRSQTNGERGRLLGQGRELGGVGMVYVVLGRDEIDDTNWLLKLKHFHILSSEGPISMCEQLLCELMDLRNLMI